MIVPFGPVPPIRVGISITDIPTQGVGFHVGPGTAALVAVASVPLAALYPVRAETHRPE